MKWKPYECKGSHVDAKEAIWRQSIPYFVSYYPEVYRRYNFVRYYTPGRGKILLRNFTLMVGEALCRIINV